jgi:ParB-like chromosome segregation protein Spo0J
MQDYGLQQPISLRTNGDRYLVTSGMRRLAAARLLGWQTVPAFVRNVSADDAYVLDLIENLQRQDLSPEEEADALGELVRLRGWTLEQVADSIKRSVGYVSKRVRVFEDDLLRDAVVNKGMPISTAEELLGVDPLLRDGLIARAMAEHWDQSQAREALRSGVSADDGDAKPAPSANNGHPPVALTSRNSPARPRGFTRAIREFHRMINVLQAQDLTQADRAALRALFRDLQLLARAPKTPQPRVFPRLPVVSRRVPDS